MSTILDALKRLQDQRERAARVEDVRRIASAKVPPPRRRRRGPIVVGSLLWVLLLAAVSAALWIGPVGGPGGALRALLPGRDESREGVGPPVRQEDAAPELAGPRMAAPATRDPGAGGVSEGQTSGFRRGPDPFQAPPASRFPAPAGAQPRSPEPARDPSGHAVQAASGDGVSSRSAAGVVPPVRPAPPSPQAAPRAGESAVGETWKVAPSRTETSPPASAKRAVQAPEPAPAKALPPAAASAQPARPVPPQTAAASAASTPGVAKPAAGAKAPPDIGPGSAETARARAEAEPVRPATESPDEPPAAPAEADLEAPIGFPELTILSIRWHPQPEQRSARIELPDGSRLELHEGDIVDGGMVRRIDPLALELGVGDERRRVLLGP